MDVNTGPNRYEALQALLVTLLFLVHIVLFMAILIGGIPMGLGIGVLELVISWKMSARLTLRATQAPTSIRSALGGLRPWLLGFGACTVLFSVAYLALALITLRWE